jgi:hypothetical protein
MRYFKNGIAVKNFVSCLIATLVFGLLFPLSVEAQKTAQEMYLQGNVRFVYTYKYVATDVVIADNKLVSYQKGKLLRHIEYIFDKNGALLAENRFDTTQNLIAYSYIYTYDDQNRLIEITNAYLGKFLNGRTEYQYDKEGKRTRGLVYDDQDSLQNTIVYRYDSLGNLIAEITYNTIAYVIKNLQHQYDQRGNCIYSVNGKTLARSNKHYQEIQKFDEHDNLIYKSFITEHDSLAWEYFARYNKKDSLIYEELKDGKGNSSSWSALKYKKDKRVLLRQQYPIVGASKTLYIYDETGKLSREEVYLQANTKHAVITRLYFYDANKNWTACVEENKITGIKTVSSRRITYF